MTQEPKAEDPQPAAPYNPYIGAGFLMKFKSKFCRLFSFNCKSLEEDVADVIQEHDTDGNYVNSTEHVLLTNVLGIRDVTIDDIMIPRSEIAAIDYNTPLNKIKEIILDKEHTRMPVYKDSLDNVIGFLHIKDIINFLGTQKKFDLGKILRQALYVPSSMKIVDLLVQMQEKRVHIAVVVDEYGGTEGLVTLEDIVEEIVGNIDDEHDEIEESDFVEIAKNTYQANARYAVEDLEKKLQVNIMNEDEAEEYETIGGLVIFKLGRVPKKGEIYEDPAGLVFEVLESDLRSIKKMLIKKNNNK